MARRKFNKTDRRDDRRSNQKCEEGVKGKESKSRDKDEDYASFMKRENRSAKNDPQWYAADPALMRDAASIPFSWVTGNQVAWNFKWSANKTLASIPGVQTITLIPSVGNADNPNSPINVAATSVYTFVRHANSGSANYDSPDLMLMLLAMSSVYSYINYLQRIYGCATMYSQRNRYLPRTLLLAQGVNPDDVQSNLADFRYNINVLINKASSLAVPATMSIFKRMAFLYSNVYSEGTSIKDQLYMYVPESFYIYSIGNDMSGELTSELVGSTTKGGTRPNRYLSVSQLIAFGNRMLDALLGDEDIGIMSGDILKAYGSNILSLTSLPEEYPMNPVFDIGVLEQMKNATIVNFDSPGYTGPKIISQVYQSTDKSHLLNTSHVSLTTPTTKYNDALPYLLCSNRVLTTTTADVTPDLVMESSRLIVAGVASDTANIPSEGGTVELISGSEIPCQVTWWMLDPRSENVSEPCGNGVHSKHCGMFIGVRYSDDAVQSVELEDIANVIEIFNVASNFDFAPMIWYVSVPEDLATAKSVATLPSLLKNADRPMIDIDNYAVLTAEDIHRLHEAAIMNMLNVPSIAKVQG